MKVANRLSVEKNRIWRYLPIKKISLLGIGSIPSKADFNILFSNLSGILDVNILQSISDNEKKKIISLADEAISHQFDLLGSDPRLLDPICWHNDFKSGYSWPKGVFYLKQRTKMPEGVDIKVPWELSRCQHLLWIGEAYLLTGKNIYAKEIREEIEDWIEENPLMRSVNWTCAMDVSFRAVNWIYALGMVLSSPEIDDLFVAKVYKSLYQHGFYVFNNLERIIPYSNNHYFSDIVGLLFLSQLFKNNKRGKKWFNFAVREYYSEIRIQILPSGPQFERSISYHRMMTELSAYSYYMLKRIGVSIPLDVTYRIKMMYRFVSNYTKPNGMAPLIEDNDDGRFLPFLKRDFRVHSYLIINNSIENIIAINKEKPLFDTGYCPQSFLYEDAGHCILRNEKAYVFITNGGQSIYHHGEQKMIGTHTHNDQLSFELSVGEDDIIIDPGAYVYTPNPEKNREFKSTRKHNTIIVDDEEQNDLSPVNVFHIKPNTEIEPMKQSGKNTCEGQYATIKGGMKHKRSFELSENSLILCDRISKKGNRHQLTMFFHLAPEVKCERKKELIILSIKYLRLEMEIASEADTDISLIEDTISPSYGVIKDSKTILVRMVFDNNVDVNTIIRWQKK